MSLEERVYSVLIVSASNETDASLSSFFSLPRFAPVTVVPGVSAAKRALSQRAYDLVIVNSPLPEGGAVAFTLDTVRLQRAVVLFLSRSGQYDGEYDALISNGVFALRKPVPRAVMEIASGWMVSARELMRISGDQAQTLEEKMKEIRVVNRAKWLLIAKENMTEPEAHRYIEKSAMDRCVSKLAVAESVIRRYG